jgi:hypothetical protein
MRRETVRQLLGSIWDCLSDLSWSTYVIERRANRIDQEWSGSLAYEAPWDYSNHLWQVLGCIRAVAVDWYNPKWMAPEGATPYCDDRCASLKGYPCNCVMAAFNR